jgi:Spy/CpxP family protein refolding chaperone
MKTSVLLPVAALMFGLPAVAAPEAAPPKSPLARLEAMREHLKLTDSQWEKLQPLLKQEGEKVREILADSSLSVEQKKAEARDVTAAGRDQIKDILTPEQRQKLGEEMKKRQEGRGDGPLQRLAELREKLGLTEEQLEKLKPVLEEEGPKLRALREKRELSPEERKAAFEASFGKISAMLTSEQAEKLREQMRQRRN